MAEGMRATKPGNVLAVRLFILSLVMALTSAMDVPTVLAQQETLQVPLNTDNGDPLSEGAVLLQADSVTYDPNEDIVYASGNVEIAYDGRVVFADNLTYNQQTDEVFAAGNVSVLEPNGNVFFADSVKLRDKMREGVIESFSALLEQNARLAADRGLRRDGNVNELTRATYSACNVCDSEGNDKTPLWQIKAFRVIQNQETLTITYRDVYFEFLGVPVFYLPYFSHPDPSVKRKSGFLAPTMGDSDRLGFFAEVPYYFALSPSYDLTLSPMYTGEDGLLVKADWRQRIRQGAYDLSGSLIYADERDANNFIGAKELNGHVFGQGSFAINNVWLWGFQVEAATNDTYLRRYNISNEVDLESTLYALGIKGRNYLDARVYRFQGLRITDSQGETPLVLPLVRGHYVIENSQLGRFNLDVNALVIQRTDGVDSRRISFSGDWKRGFTTRNGQVITPFANVRMDVYSVNDMNPDGLPHLPDNSDVIYRALPTAGLEWRWPFVRTTKSVRFVIEPIVQVVVSSNGGNPEQLPNEDSQTFDFDTTNLFRPNKSPGLDLWENGRRLNVGVKLGAYWGGGKKAQFMFGRSFRTNDHSPFGPETSLNDETSDYVGSLTLAPSKHFTLTHRFRLDGETQTVRRNEVDAIVNYGPVSARARYIKSDRLSEITGIPAREELTLNGTIKLHKNWRVRAGTVRDLEINDTRQSSIGLIYEDECTIFTIALNRRFFNDRDIKPDDSIIFNLILKTLN